MQNNDASLGLPRKLVIAMPGLSTALTAASVLFFRNAPVSWRTETVEGLAGGALVALSTVSFLAICKYSALKN